MARSKVRARKSTSIAENGLIRKVQSIKSVRLKVIPTITNILGQLEKDLRKQEKTSQSSLKKLDGLLTKAKSKREKAFTKLEQLELKGAIEGTPIRNPKELKQLQKVMAVLEKECQILEGKLSKVFDDLSSCQFELEILLRLKETTDNLKGETPRVPTSFCKAEQSSLKQPEMMAD